MKAAIFFVGASVAIWIAAESYFTEAADDTKPSGIAILALGNNNTVGPRYHEPSPPVAASGGGTSKTDPPIDIGHDFNYEALNFTKFDKAKLFAIYQSGIRPGASDENRLLAFSAANTCFPFIQSLQLPEVPGMTGDAFKQSADLRTSMRSRCAAFLSTPVNELRENILSLSDSLFVKNSRFSLKAYESIGRNPSDEQKIASSNGISRALEENGATALEWMAPALGDWITQEILAKNPSLDPVFSETESIFPAVAIAKCLSGFYCGAESSAMGFMCGYAGHCGTTMTEAVLSSIAPSKRELVLRQADVIAKAIRTGQLGKLGLIKP